VKAYGGEMPLNQVGTGKVPEPRMITVQVWDRSLVTPVEKAIREANLGVNPQSDGQLVRLPIPELSQERRQEMTKIAHKYAEHGRVAVRNVRRDGMETLKKMEKDGKISEDEHRRHTDEVQKLTDDHIKKLTGAQSKKVDGVLSQKEKEILQF